MMATSRGKIGIGATVLLSIALIAIQSRTANAQSCNAQYCDFSLGNYTVQNDEWGLGSDPGGGQEIYANGSGWYAGMSWQYDGGGVKSYPSIIAGWNFTDAWSPNNDGFPVLVSANANLPTSTSWYTTGTFTNYDVAYDLFFSPSTGPQQPSEEVMVWIGGTGDAPAGSQIASNVTLGNEPYTWNVWQGNVGWPVYTFVCTSTVNNFSANLQPFIYYLAYSHNYLPQNWYELGMMFGTEVQAASGDFYDTSFFGNANGNENGGGTTGGGTTGGGGGSLTPGTYTLAPQCATGSRLDDNSAATTNGNKIQIYQANGTGAQNWSIATSGVSPSGDWNLATEGPYCLQASGSTSGSAAELWSCDGASSQSWKAVADSSPTGYYQLQPANATGLCLDVSGAGTTNGTQVQVYTCNNTNAQQWAFAAN